MFFTPQIDFFLGNIDESRRISKTKNYTKSVDHMDSCFSNIWSESVKYNYTTAKKTTCDNVAKLRKEAMNFNRDMRIHYLFEDYEHEYLIKEVVFGSETLFLCVDQYFDDKTDEERYQEVDTYCRWGGVSSFGPVAEAPKDVKGSLPDKVYMDEHLRMFESLLCLEQEFA